MARIDWTDALQLETEVAILIKEQEEYGVYFDHGKAVYYISLLEKLKEEKYKAVRPFLTYEVIIKETKTKGEEGYSYNYVKKIRLLNGNYTATIINWYDDPSIVDGPFSRIEIEEPSIGKRGLIINQLLKFGWQPKEFTEKGFPKLTNKGEPVDTLEEVGTFGKDLSMWYTYSHRQSQIRGFLPHIREDGRISAQCDPCGTNTFRGKHRVVANIPRPTSVFGKEMRSLFRVREGRVFVGADVSGLELRMLAHHMNDPEYIRQILSGDIHLYNLYLTGKHIYPEGLTLPLDMKDKVRLAVYREVSKTFIYAFLYGGGDGKIGSIVHGSSAIGKALKNTFFESLPALSNLSNKVRNFAQKYGFLPAIDGRKIYVRVFEGKVLVHTALNCLLQANGSIVTKRAMIIAAAEIKRRGLNAHQIIFYHDEMAYDSAPECAEEVGEILIDSMRLAGEYYNLNIPITGEYKIGMDWGVH